MIDRQRRNELLGKAVAVVALIATIGIGIAVFATVSPMILGRSSQPSTARPNALSSPPPPPVENIRPLQVRPVQELRSPDECPPEGQVPQVPPNEVLNACDFNRGATYVLGPQALELRLTRVETLKSPTTEFHVVRITMDSASAKYFGAYTAQHIDTQVAFLRDGVVVFAPKITTPINAEGLEISGELTAEQAEEVARLLRKP